MKAIDLFSGIGGLSLGFREAGFDICLANEIEKSIAESYVKNHQSTKMINEDITKLDIETTFKNYLGITVIIGGPPCQGFSQKGKRLSLKDPRNYLFKYFFEVVKYVLPQYFVIENVPNLLTAANGHFKNEIFELFTSIGYSLDTDVLNSSEYGVPQNRKRAIIIGKKGSGKVPFPKKVQQKVTIWEAISDLAYLQSAEGEFEQEYKLPIKSLYQKELRKDSAMLFNHVATKHSNLAIDRMNLVPINGGRSDLPVEHHTKSIFSGTWGRMNKEGQSITITTRFDTPSSGRFTHPFLNRAITVREAARIQSFPDDIIFYGSKTSQMKQVGNAVPPLLAKKIAEAIIEDRGE